MDGEPRILIAAAGAPARRFSPGMPWLLLIICCVAGVGVILASPVGAVIAKGLCDPFFYSTSSGGAVSLLMLCAAGAVGITLNPLRAKSQLIRATAIVGASCVLVGNAANLIAHLTLSQSLGLPLSLPVYHWVNDTNTYSYLLHTHAGKTGINILFSALSRDWAPSYDIGAGLATGMPAWAGALFASTLLGAIASLALLLPSVIARFGGYSIPLLYGYCAVNCIKTIVDGGPLTYRFIPAFCVLAVLLARTVNPRRHLTPLLVATAASILAAYLALWAVFTPANGAEAVGSFLETLTIIILLAAGYRAEPSLELNVRDMVRATAASVLAASVVASLVATPVILLLPLDSDMRATVCDLVSLKCSERSVAGKRAFDVYRSAGDNALKPHHTFLFKVADRGDSRMLFAVRPIQVGTPNSVRGDAIKVEPIRTSSMPASVLVEASSASLPRIFAEAPSPFSGRNYYVFLHLAAAQLRAQGLAEFAMVPLRGARDAEAFGVR